MMSTSKKRKTSTPDRVDAPTPTGPSPYVRRMAKVGHAALRKPRNDDFLALKGQLHKSAVQEIMESDVNQKLFQNGGPRLPISADGGVPVFVNASITDLRWDLASARDMFDRPVGDVISMGQEDAGQLGLISQIGLERDDGFPPTVLRNIGHGIIQVAAGGMHSVGLSQDGVAYTWGCGDDGPLARVWPDGKDDDEEPHTTTPTEVKSLIPSAQAVSQHTVRNTKNEAHDVISIAAGTSHTLFLTISGNVYSAGTYKDLDSGHFCDIRAPDDPTRNVKEKPHASCEGVRREPVHVFRMPQRARFIAAGGSFNAAILADGTLVTWGMGHSGELARSKGVTKLIDKESGLPDLGHAFYREVKDGQKAYNHDKVNEHFLTPKPVHWAGGMPRLVVTHLACGNDHLLVAARKAHESSSRLYSAGLNNYGKLGHGDEAGRHEVTLVQALKDTPIARVAAGSDHSIILNAKGDTIYACGRGGYGQLGIPRSQLQTKKGGKLSDDKKEGFTLVPLPVAFPTTDRLHEIGRFVDVQCGENHSMAITTAG